MITRREMNDNDVLCGRGSGPSQFIGNRRFRSLVEALHTEYSSTPTNKAKQIAREIVSHIHEIGGRFLKQVEAETPANDIEDEDVWIEVEEAVALEKCMQAIRDLNRVSSDGNGGRNRGRGEDRSLQQNDSDLTIPAVSLPQSSTGLQTSIAAAAPLSLGSVQEDPTSLPKPSLHLTPILPLMLDERLLHFQASSSALQERTIMSQPAMVNRSYPPQLNLNNESQNNISTPYSASMSQGLLQEQYNSETAGASAADSALSSWLPSAMPQIDSVSPELGRNSKHQSAKEEAVAGQSESSCAATTARRPLLENDVILAASDDDLSKFLLSLLIKDRPMITEEQLELEQAAMTDEERVETLMDLFGKQCAIDTHQNKRAKKDLDKNSIAFLVLQMRLEVERIPEDGKQALLEAQKRCRGEEFSDARLERFLRCEGMNTKQGAQRFVNYWESRRKVFGPDKFVLRMTLSKALRDDLAAVEACFFHPLPRLDESGRQLLLVEPSCHTREGYTSESMLRALWYVIEVMAQENTHINSGFVAIDFCKDFTMWDNDHGLYAQLIYFMENCWPIKSIASHLCCAPSIVVRILKLTTFVLMDKHTRSRKVVHDIPESQLLDILSCYGIHKEMLPTQMGGTVQLDQAKWIADRRAAELMEI